MKLLLATHNKGKVKDLQSLLSDSPFEVLSLDDWGEIPDVEEDGDTFLANAEKKAREYHRLTGLPTLADDSGLVVDALNGDPGVRSARYAGEPSDSAKNREKLLEELAKSDSSLGRRARFECVLVYVDDRGHRIVTEGTCEGEIAWEPKGYNGFGYDPVFVHASHGGRTMGEVSREEKNVVSHRGVALRRMRTELIKLIG